MRRFLFALFVSGVLALGGCGDGNDSPSPFVTQILSDATFDGDIARDTIGMYTVTQGAATQGSLYVGIDPADDAELRAFLDFPLTGSTGVPGNAIISRATLDLFINSIQPNPLVGTIPIRIDLVSFTPLILVGSDFDRTLQPALATMTIAPPISQSDFGRHVLIDVTDLMREAQRLGLPDLQLRILRDPGNPALGLIEINDTTGANRGQLAPLLEVVYF